MMKPATAIALAFAVSVGAFSAVPSTAEAAPKAKYYSIKQGKWLPLDQHPMFDKKRASKKKATKKRVVKRKSVTKKRASLVKRKKTKVSRKSSKSRKSKLPPLFASVLGRRSTPQQSVSTRRSSINESPIPRTTTAFSTSEAPGTIIIDVSDRRLYHVGRFGTATVYGVAVGKEGFGWTGTEKVTRKTEWPSWTPPKEMIKREAAKGRHLPDFMEGGPNNPLGARALYLGSTLYRIHGTNNPASIGHAASSGCFRMANNDVIHLYNQVSPGTKVVVRP